MSTTLADIHEISAILCLFSAGAAAVMGLSAALVTLVSVIVSHPAIVVLRGGVFVLGGLWLLVAALLLTIHTIARYRLVQRETVP